MDFRGARNVADAAAGWSGVYRHLIISSRGVQTRRGVAEVAGGGGGRGGGKNTREPSEVHLHVINFKCGQIFNPMQTHTQTNTGTPSPNTYSHTHTLCSVLIDVETGGVRETQWIGSACALGLGFNISSFSLSLCLPICLSLVIQATRTTKHPLPPPACETM